MFHFPLIFFQNSPLIFPKKRNFCVIILAMLANLCKKIRFFSYPIDNKLALPQNSQHTAHSTQHTAHSTQHTALAINPPETLFLSADRQIRATRILNQKSAYSHNFRKYKALPYTFAWRCLFSFLSQNWFIKKLHI